MDEATAARNDLKRCIESTFSGPKVKHCPDCSAPMESQISVGFKEPLKTYLELYCSNGHNFYKVDITSVASGLTLEELKDYARKLIQELESA